MGCLKSLLGEGCKVKYTTHDESKRLIVRLLLALQGIFAMIVKIMYNLYIIELKIFQ